MNDCVPSSGFPSLWRARILPARPAILPARHFVYPREAEEVERGALEAMVRPQAGEPEFLATCALGFADPMVPTGIWSCPNPRQLCAVSGGYAYVIDTHAPERFAMIPYRPVLEVLVLREMKLLLFVGHRAVLAWGADGSAWESEKLSSEGLTNLAIEGTILRGRGWDMHAGEEAEFTIDLRSGRRVG